MATALLVVNPAAGARHGALRASQLSHELRARGVGVSIAFTTAGRDTDLERSILDAEVVIAVGGDGTLNRVAEVVIRAPRSDRSAPVIGFLPCGTGNVAVRALRLPRKVSEVADLVVAQTVRTLDAGVVSRDGEVVGVFLLWAGVGVDASLLETVGARRGQFQGWKLLWEYTREAIRMSFVYRFPSIELVAEDVYGRFGAVVVANVGRLIFGSITCSADPSDGKLNVIATKPRRRIGWLWAVSLYAMHRYETCSRVYRQLAKSVQLRSVADRVPIHVDGEPAGNLPVQIRVAPGSVVLLAPPEQHSTPAG
jgi:diacylglycerol kinase (ATP)